MGGESGLGYVKELTGRTERMNTWPIYRRVNQVVTFIVRRSRLMKHPWAVV